MLLLRHKNAIQYSSRDSRNALTGSVFRIRLQLAAFFRNPEVEDEVL